MVFKVGDRVRFIEDRNEGQIVDIWGDTVFVGFGEQQPEAIYVESVELVEEQPNRTQHEATPVDPDHYKFPGGAEVIDISQWLTANAAQALQYVARSSRIDGKNKGDASEDIRKAITFLEFELKRLESE